MLPSTHHSPVSLLPIDSTQEKPLPLTQVQLTPEFLHSFPSCGLFSKSIAALKLTSQIPGSFPSLWIPSKISNIYRLDCMDYDGGSVIRAQNVGFLFMFVIHFLHPVFIEALLWNEAFRVQS